MVSSLYCMSPSRGSFRHVFLFFNDFSSSQIVPPWLQSLNSIFKKRWHSYMCKGVERVYPLENFNFNHIWPLHCVVKNRLREFYFKNPLCDQTLHKYGDITDGGLSLNILNDNGYNISWNFAYGVFCSAMSCTVFEASHSNKHLTFTLHLQVLHTQTSQYLKPSLYFKVL